MANRVKNPLDRFSGKRDPGRPPIIEPALVRNYADRYRVWLERSWDQLGTTLLTAKTEQEVVSGLQRTLPGYDELPPLAPLILKVVNEPGFPKKQKKAQIGFLADSLGARGIVTPRRSRDICVEQRKTDAQRHYIMRHEYWVECSCGYKGVSENHSCKICGAVLYLPNNSDSEY
jgi:hypothetical protein